MAYLLSQEYRRDNELAVNALDPRLALPIPKDITPLLSQRDRQAPTLAAAHSAGLLPDYEACLRAEAELA